MRRNKALRLLELGDNPSREDIETAHKRLVFQWHPDRNTSATDAVRAACKERTQELNEAREVLLAPRVVDDAEPDAGDEPSDPYAEIDAARGRNDWDAVIELARRLLRIKSAERKAHVYLADAFNQKGEFGRAESAATEAVSIEPSDDVAWFLLAWALANQRKWLRANEAISKAVHLCIPPPPKYMELWRAIEQEMRSDSIEGGNHENATALPAEIELAADIGDWGTVARLALALADIPGCEQPARKYLSKALTENGRFDKAAEVAREATQWDSKDFTAWLLLSVAESRRGDWQEARKAVESAMKVCPNDHTEMSALSNLRDNIHSHILAGKSLSERTADLLAGRCSVCGKESSFAEGECGHCGYVSPVRAATSHVKRSIKTAIDPSGGNKDGNPSWCCPSCGYSTGYADGNCHNCGYRSREHTPGSQHAKAPERRTDIPSVDSAPKRPELYQPTPRRMTDEELQGAGCAFLLLGVLIASIGFCLVTWRQNWGVWVLLFGGIAAVGGLGALLWLILRLGVEAVKKIVSK